MMDSLDWSVEEGVEQLDEVVVQAEQERNVRGCHFRDRSY